MKPRCYLVIKIRCEPFPTVCVDGGIVSGAGILLLLREQYLIVTIKP